MLVKRLEAERDNVIGLVPVYTDTGNATKVLLKSGEAWIDNRTIKTARSVLARSYAIDLKAQRLRIENMLNRKGPLPFYINQRVFMQLKLREAITENDMVYGFIDIDYVKSLESIDKGARCEAILINGKRLQVFSGYNTALKAKQTGEKLLELIKMEEEDSSEENEVVKSVVTFIASLKEISRRLERIEDKIAEGGISWDVSKEN